MKRLIAQKEKGALLLTPFSNYLNSCYFLPGPALLVTFAAFFIGAAFRAP